MTCFTFEYFAQSFVNKQTWNVCGLFTSGMLSPGTTGWRTKVSPEKNQKLLKCLFVICQRLANVIGRLNLKIFNESIKNISERSAIPIVVNWFDD